MPGLGRSALLVGAGLVAAVSGPTAQLAFAGLAVLAIGLPHGASDHLIAVGPGWRPLAWLPFYLAYLGLVAAVVVAWRLAPGPTLCGFLLVSAVHFGFDDRPDLGPGEALGERVARGLMPLTLPGLLHERDLASLFGLLSDPAWGEALAGGAHRLAPLVFGGVVAVAAGRFGVGERRAALGLGALAAGFVLLPPLVSFSLYFALVHSRGQTLHRMRELGIATVPTYLRAVSPILAGATLVFAGVAVLFATDAAPAMSTLFVGIAALTVPHVLVTPVFARRRRAQFTSSFSPSRSMMPANFAVSAATKAPNASGVP